MADGKSYEAYRVKGQHETLWFEFETLTAKYGALSLGQGLPDSFPLPPEHLKEALARAAMSPNNYQYTRSAGHPRFVKALGQFYSPIFGREINPYEEILTSVGGYCSLFCSIQALVNPGDEVVVFEPYFKCYDSMITMAGGVPVFVALHPTSSNTTSSAEFRLDPTELESKFNANTKLVIFNTPNNPLGKVYTLEEMILIADLCKKHDVIVISDEVYEWLVYPPNKHFKIATLPEMWERTLTIGSGGKMFNATGLKCSWTIGPKHLIQACAVMHQSCIYRSPTIIQEALAVCFETELARRDQPDFYGKTFVAEILIKRDKLVGLLKKAGMTPIVPEGGYFMMVDFSELAVQYQDNSDDPKDLKFVRWMTKEKKLAALPCSIFYSKENRHLGEKYLRFCFIKEDSTFEKAAEIFNKWNA